MGTPELPVPAGLVLRPFRGVRFAVEDPAKVTSPPYDLISDADVEVLLDSHPNNVVRLILPCSSRSNSSPETPQAQQATAPGQPADPASPTAETPLQPRYAVARDTLKEWLDSGVLVRDDVPALYVYEQSGPNVLQRGLIGDVGLADPGQRIILPHEDVFPGPIADRLALMSTTQANLEPIFLLYDGGDGGDGDGAATRLVDEVASTRHPLVAAHTEDGLTHRLWAITAPEEIAAINADLHHRQALIADGHHRYATYRVLQRQERATHHELPDYDDAALGPWDFGLALLVDSHAYPPDLKAIHRVVHGLPLNEAVARAKGSWQVHDYKDLAAGLAALERAAEPAFLLAGEDGSHLLTDPDPVQLARAMPPDRSERWNSLNTSVLSEFVLPVVWGMRDNDQTVRIVHHDTDAAVRLAIQTGGTAVILKPLAVDDVLAIAAGGERVPRKSTSFGPKPRTGLVLRTFANG
ncbi:DUF1015 domain-containing protein [Nonomuraea gerenzanensis]|uniref:Related to HTH domain of SpoOJ/ParA/ParB/repB family, involved in chromosome partitioning n=2 Tax=Nonomuraea gerenzanensis TaxID=93944 RepID=A0A1M4EHV9_9ACTN|nr:DUF1015 domain-containing protein [Nonomuraea gerenzanensis]SBO98258.1 Related to HTH domain of SpoOJ/ParA/ParB/repB family, involved in chromosome partitioning [Nonomuraea gerenzanensis]